MENVNKRVSMPVGVRKDGITSMIIFVFGLIFFWIRFDCNDLVAGCQDSRKEFLNVKFGAWKKFVDQIFPFVTIPDTVHIFFTIHLYPFKIDSPKHALAYEMFISVL